MVLKPVLYGLLIFTCLQPVFAKNIVVDKSSPVCNDQTGNIFCHLNAAIFAAEEGDEITIASGIYEEILSVDKNLSIKGNSPRDVVIDAGQKETVMKIEPGVRLKLAAVTLQNGRGEKAGGILNYGSLFLSDCVIRDNASLTSGGGIYNASSISGSLLIELSSIENNVALGDDPNHVKYGGGGIFNNSPMQIDRSNISGNIAVGNGGGIYNIFAGRAKPTEGELAAERLGVVTSKARVTNLRREHQAGSVKIINSQIIKNVAEAGGGVYAQGVLGLNSVVVEGNSAVFGDRSAGGGVYAHFDVVLDINNSRIRNNVATFIGGGVRFYSIRSGSIENVNIANNRVLKGYGWGAGLYLVKGTVPLNIFNSSIADNLIADLRPSDCHGELHSTGYNYLVASPKCILNKIDSDFILH